MDGARTFWAVIGAVIPVFAIAGAGFGLRKLDWLSEEADESLLRLTINLLTPCLVLDAALGNAALSRWGNLMLAPLMGFGTVVLGLMVGRWLAGWSGLEEDRKRRTFALAVGLYNYGFVPIPLTVLLFDQATLGVLFIHNVGVELALWTVGLVVLTGGKAQWRKLVNAPLIAILLVLLLNFTGGHAVVPEVIRTAVHLLGQCAIPMSLLLIGATVADHVNEFPSGSVWRVIGVATVLRMLVLPACFLALIRLLPASVELKRVVVLEAAMASAVFPIVMAKHYGGDTPTALRVVLGTSVVSLVTIPIWVRVGMKWLGL